MRSKVVDLDQSNNGASTCFRADEFTTEIPLDNTLTVKGTIQATQGQAGTASAR